MEKDEARLPKIPFHAGPGTVHEIGVMIAFIAAFVLTTLGYLWVWKRGNRREEAREVQRRQLLRDRHEASRETKSVPEPNIFDASQDEWDRKGNMVEHKGGG